VSSLCHARRLAALLNALPALSAQDTNPGAINRVMRYSSLVTVATAFLFGDNFSESLPSSLLLAALGTARIIVLALPYFQLLHLLVIFKENIQSLNSEIISIKQSPEASDKPHAKSTHLNQVVPSKVQAVIRGLSQFHHQLCELAQELNSIYDSDDSNGVPSDHYVFVCRHTVSATDQH
jgi:hypothetical protein